MDSKRCCICNRKMSAAGGSSMSFGSVHHSCANRAEDFVRAMAKINQCSADEYLSECGKPSMATENEPMAKFVREQPKVDPLMMCIIACLF